MSQQAKNKAMFLDRDGVINELVYYAEQDILDSPYSVRRFKLLSGVAEGINALHKLSYKIIVASNQPGIAKGYMTVAEFEKIRQKMADDLATDGAYLDGEYYCLHHSLAKDKKLKDDCDCHKPKPGLLLQASKDFDINLSQSWMIGDNVIDIQAGRAAGCKTVLIGRLRCETCQQMQERNIQADIIAANLIEAADKIEAGNGR